MAIKEELSPQVSQASGMVSVQAECTVEAALGLLKERSRVTGDSLLEVAEATVGRRIRFGQPTPLLVVSSPDPAEPEASWAAQREAAVADLDALIALIADACADLETFQSALAKSRAHLSRGRHASEWMSLIDVPLVQTTLTEKLNLVERARRVARRSFWQLLVTEGTSITDIARGWGLSRQLVSRVLGGDPQPGIRS